MTDFSELRERAESFAKPRRKKDRKLLDRVKQMPCCVCSYDGSPFNPIDPSHIRGRGAGGPDEAWNICPMCRECHRLWHSLGPLAFCRHFPGFRDSLESRGWYFDGHRLRHPKLEKGE